MNVQGADCSVVVRTVHREMNIAYAEETLRDAYSLLIEEAAIEGAGNCKAVRKAAGVTGCVVTPLSINATPLLLYLAFGSAGKPVSVAKAGGVYRCNLDLVPQQDSGRFDLIQDRGGQRRLYSGFELRVMREEDIKLKLDVCGENPASIFEYAEKENRPESERQVGERFNGNNVTYKINGIEYQNIYGVTLVSRKQGGTRTELWIKRAKQKETAVGGFELPDCIEKMSITAQLVRQRYGQTCFGTFRITLENLVLVSDETNVNSADAVIGPLRYYVSGAVSADVFSCGSEVLQ
jgi:hypothetical protein